MADDDLIIDGYKLNPVPVATGNSSEIYEVLEQSGGQPLCMKLLLPETLKNAAAKAVLKHEAKVGKGLDHPSIIKVHKISVTKKHGYMLMDLFRAPNIKTQIATDLVGLHTRFRKVFESLCLALGYMHEKGWVHRDIKPENILSNKVGELRLIDFSLSVRAAGGLGKLLGARTKAVQGTKTYIAPETLLKKSPSLQTDMYSLGITVFEMLTGFPPFRGTSPGELLRMHVQEKAPAVSFYNKNVTPEMDRLVDKLLVKKPANRPKNMEEVYSEFRALKIFKEDPKELDAVKQRNARRRKSAGWEPPSGSIAGATTARSEAGLNAPPEPAKPKAEPKPLPAAPPRQPAAGGPAAPVAGQPMPGQGYVPPACRRVFPIRITRRRSYGFPPGMQLPPGYPYPQLPPGYQPQGPLPPGYIPPGMPMQPPVPSSPPPQQEAIPKPNNNQPPLPPPQIPLRRKPAPKTKKQEEEDLPLMEMDELPDVLVGERGASAP